MKSTSLTIASIALLLSAAIATAQNTVRKSVNESANQTMLVTNNTTFDISRIKVRFRYTNYETGELLHQRDEWLDCEIPAGATRSVDIASFDRHRRFYYYLSPRSRRQATPFAVAVKILRYDIIATATD